jgi:hypothetical protein
MSERTFFEHYVLGGGWAMLLLLPALVVTLFAGVRGLLVVRAARQSGASHLAARLEELHERHGALSLHDARSEVEAMVNSFCALLLPLQAVFVLAPLAAVAGSVWRVMTAAMAASAGSVEPFAAEVEQALVPLLWGVAIAALAYGLHWMIRIAILSLERDMLIPAADEAVERLSARLGGRRRVFNGAGEPPA